MRSKLLAFILFASALAFGQTTVNVTVTDGDSQTWNNGTYAVQLVNSPGQPQGPWTVLGGAPVSSAQQTGVLSGTGTFSIVLQPNANLGPAGSIYNFTVCAQAVPTPCLTQQVTVTVATPQTLNLTPAAIRINMGSPPYPSFVSAYLDGEVTNAIKGQMYYNLSNPGLRQWNGSAWGPVAGAVASAGGTNFQAQVNSNGVLSGIAFGNAGQVLLSNGSSAAPTFQDPLVSGPDPVAGPPSKNPVLTAGIDGTNVRTMLTDSSGREVVNVNSLPALVAGSATIGAVTQASGPWTVNQTQVNGNAVATQAAGVQQEAGWNQQLSPTTLGFNAITLPASGTTALSNIIDLRGVKAISLFNTCTQGPTTVNIQVYAEDGTTVVNGAGGSSIANAIAANAPFYGHVGSESTWNVANGTATTSTVGMMPQRAFSISVTNGSASAGTCTARLFLQY